MFGRVKRAVNGETANGERKTRHSPFAVKRRCNDQK
jgi:hypothetical protein